MKWMALVETNSKKYKKYFHKSVIATLTLGKTVAIMFSCVRKWQAKKSVAIRDVIRDHTIIFYVGYFSLVYLKYFVDFFRKKMFVFSTECFC